MTFKLKSLAHLLFTLLIVSTCFLMQSCDPDDPEDEEEELITTLNYTLTSSTGDTVVLRFQDLDGDGGNAPEISGATLTANTIYSGSMELLNESVDPVENITEEILEEDEEHQFFFSFSVSEFDVDYTDEDENGFPVGLATTLTTGGASSGQLTVKLIHKPEKDAENVAAGSSVNAGGETDIEVSFPIVVE